MTHIHQSRKVSNWLKATLKDIQDAPLTIDTRGEAQHAHASSVATSLLTTTISYATRMHLIVRFGKRQCRMNWIPYMPMTLAIFVTCLLGKNALELIGCIRLSKNLMDQLTITEFT